MNNEPTANVIVRMPKALHKKIKVKAEKNVRSLNSEIIVAVQRYVYADESTETEQAAEKAAKAAAKAQQVTA